MVVAPVSCSIDELRWSTRLAVILWWIRKINNFFYRRINRKRQENPYDIGELLSYTQFQFFTLKGVSKLNHPPSDNLCNIVTRERGSGRAKCCPNIICHRWDKQTEAIIPRLLSKTFVFKTYHSCNSHPNYSPEKSFATIIYSQSFTISIQKSTV